MEITSKMDLDIRTKMADAVADEFDNWHIDWESDDEAIGYYVDAMKRIWGVSA